jgi:hypothetical protein
MQWDHDRLHHQLPRDLAAPAAGPAPQEGPVKVACTDQALSRLAAVRELVAQGKSCPS